MINMQGTMGNEKIICRLYIRQRCTRGDSCPFYHPGYNLNPDSPTVSWLNFCPEFKLGRCFHQDCRFFHVTPDEEDTYRIKKDIAPSLLEQAMRKALLLDVALTGTRATCKGFLQGGCSLSSCPYRHITRHEFANEVLNTLRNEFDIVLGSPAVNVPVPTIQPPYTPAPVAVPNPQIISPRMPSSTNNKESPEEHMKKLEAENEEIYRALDPNQKANDLEEIRSRLLTLQAALRWKDEVDTGTNKGGFIDDGLPPGMAVVDYGHSGNQDYNQGQSYNQEIDYMRRRDPLPMEPMYGRNDNYLGNRALETDNYDNSPMDLDQGDRDHPDKESDCKLFVGGLDERTETDDLRDHFSRFGELVDAIVMRDKNNKKSRGFGFVTYLKSYMAENAARSGHHRVNGKLVDAKFAKPRPADDPKASPPRSRRRSPSPNRGENSIPKLFIGGLSDEITTEVLTNYFQRYGRIVDAVSMQDPKTRRPRGFGFVEFHDEMAIKDALADSPHVICGCNVTVDRSMPRDSSKRNEPAPRGGSRGGGGGGGGSGRSGGRGRDGGAEGGGEPCKMFVGGLSFNTGERNLKEYFSQYGTVVDVAVQRDASGSSKGYGFVTFSEPLMVEDAIDSGPHELDGRRVDTGYAANRPDKKREREPRDRRSEPRRRSPDRSDNRSSDDECKLYIGNIPKDLIESDLEDHFMRYGDIKRVEIKQKNQNNSKGYGFVTFEEPQCLTNAIEDAPHEINGFPLETGRANSKGNKDNRSRGGDFNDRRNFRGSRDDNSGENSQPNKLFVGGLSYDTTEAVLYEYFCKYGEIKEAKVNTDNRGTSKGYGFITFADEMAVREAMEDTPHEIDGRQVKLGSATSRNQDRRDGGDRRRRDRSPEPPSLSSKRKAEKRSHLD